MTKQQERTSALKTLAAADAEAARLEALVEEDGAALDVAHKSRDAAKQAFDAADKVLADIAFKTFNDSNDRDAANVKFNNLFAALIPTIPSVVIT